MKRCCDVEGETSADFLLLWFSLVVLEFEFEHFNGQLAEFNPKQNNKPNGSNGS